MRNHIKGYIELKTRIFKTYTTLEISPGHNPCMH